MSAPGGRAAWWAGRWLVGEEVEGVWRLAILDAALGSGGHHRPWSLWAVVDPRGFRGPAGRP